MPLLAADLLPQPVQPEVRELEHESGVDHAVGRLEVAVGLQLAAMEESHALECKMHAVTDRK